MRVCFDTLTFTDALAQCFLHCGKTGVRGGVAVMVKRGSVAVAPSW